MKKINIIGQKYNMLSVIDEISVQTNKRKRRYVKCICDCGNTVIIEKNKVRSGRTKSCGCLQLKTRKSLGSKFKKEYGEASFNECYTSYKRGAKRRGYQFKLTKEEFKEIITQPCIYCGAVLVNEKKKKGSNGTFKYTGIDRYDNTKGYTIDNCVPCCKVCNRIKTNMSINDMEKQLTIILSRKNIWQRTA